MGKAVENKTKDVVVEGIATPCPDFLLSPVVAHALAAEITDKTGTRIFQIPMVLFILFMPYSTNDKKNVRINAFKCEKRENTSNIVAELIFDQKISLTDRQNNIFSRHPYNI